MTPFPARPPSPCSDAMPASNCAEWRPCSPPRPPPPPLLGRDPRQKVRKGAAIPPPPPERGGGLVRPLRPQIYVGARPPPQLQPAGPADLVELEIPLVARIAVVAAPDLHRRSGVAHQRRHALLGAGRAHPIRLVGRPHGPLCGLRLPLGPVRIESLGAQRH